MEHVEMQWRSRTSLATASMAVTSRRITGPAGIKRASKAAASRQSVPHAANQSITEPAAAPASLTMENVSVQPASAKAAVLILANATLAISTTSAAERGPIMKVVVVLRAIAMVHARTNRNEF